MKLYIVNDEVERDDLYNFCFCTYFSTVEHGMITRLFNALTRNGVNSIEDLADIREEHVKKWYGIGAKKLPLIMEWRERAREYLSDF